MKKSLIAVAVACALASTSALADDGNVTIYGKADLAAGTLSNGLASHGELSSQITKIGFKGSEDLGNGTAAIWQIEQQIDIDNATSGSATHTFWAGRNSFLGLKNDSIGTLMLGRHDTPYKESTRGMDVFGDQFLDNRHLMGGGTCTPDATTTASGATACSGGAYMDARPGNEIMYVTPTFSGLKVEASYAMGAESTTTSTQQKGGMTSIALMYSQGKQGLQAAVATQTMKFGSVGTGQWAAPASGGSSPLAAGDSLTGTKFGVGYNASAFKVNFVYEKISSNIAAPTGGHTSNQLGRTDMYLSGQFNIDEMNNVQLAYTKAGNTDGFSATGAKMIGVGFNHYLSKKTNVYIQYQKLSNDANANFQFNNAATDAVTYQVPGATGTTGTSPNGLLIGMRKFF